MQFKINKHVVFIALILILFIITLNMKSRPAAAAKSTTGYIYTGDSRMRRLNLTISMSKMSNTWVYAKSGMGYSWFVNNSLKDIDRIMTKHAEIENWVIVSGWGVNDLWNTENYIKKYNELLFGKWRKCKLYLMSVNPVDKNKTAKYGRIDAFNTRLKRYIKDTEKKAINRLYYIDTNSYMKKHGFSTIDGLHYTETTNKQIYSVIRNKLDKTNAVLNYQEVKMNRNAVRTIKLKNVRHKVKWKCSDNSIVQINKRGGIYNQYIVIKAVKTGVVDITATCRRQVFSCKITVGTDYPLTAYFSYYGMTEKAAEYIQKTVGGDIVFISSDPLYPLNEKNLYERILNELNADARPDILLNIRQDSNEDMHKLVPANALDVSKYTTVYLGYPVWYNYAPKVLYTFVDRCNLAGTDLNIFYSCDKNGQASVDDLVANYKFTLSKEPFAITTENGLKSSVKAELKAWAE